MVQIISATHLIPFIYIPCMFNWRANKEQRYLAISFIVIGKKCSKRDNSRRYRYNLNIQNRWKLFSFP